MTFIARQTSNSAAEHKTKRSVFFLLVLSIVGAIGWHMVEQAMNNAKPKLKSFEGSFGSTVVAEADGLNKALNPDFWQQAQQGFQNLLEGQPAQAPEPPAPTPVPSPSLSPTPTPVPEPQVSPEPTVPRYDAERSDKSIAPTPSTTAIDPYKDMPQLAITTCNATEGEGANFRAAPNLTDSSIHGVLPTGSTVYLTGNEWRDESGQTWIEVVNPNWLTPSRNPNAQYVPEPNQFGWINKCFLTK